MDGGNFNKPYRSVENRHLGKHTVAERVEELSKARMHNTAEKNGFFNCCVWLARPSPSWSSTVLFIPTTFWSWSRKAISEANKVKEAVEQGKPEQLSKFPSSLNPCLISNCVLVGIVMIVLIVYCYLQL